MTIDHAVTNGRLILKLLTDFRTFAHRQGESPAQTAERWLEESPIGRRLAEYLDDEAGLVAAVASVLTTMQDPELRELGLELEGSARRLGRLLAEGSTGDGTTDRIEGA